MTYVMGGYVKEKKSTSPRHDVLCLAPSHAYVSIRHIECTTVCGRCECVLWFSDTTGETLLQTSCIFLSKTIFYRRFQLGLWAKFERIGSFILLWWIKWELGEHVKEGVGVVRDCAHVDLCFILVFSLHDPFFLKMVLRASWEDDQ
jgi:hypothetical protein